MLLAFLHNDLVRGLEVPTEQQLLYAIAIGQFTSGPVFTTATFIGYVLGGIPGAVVATIGIFLPSFLFVGAVTPIARRIRNRDWTAALLDGVNASALGLIAGVTFQLSADALADPLDIPSPPQLGCCSCARESTAPRSSWAVQSSDSLRVCSISCRHETVSDMQLAPR